ncbi:c-type cytochrome [Halovulum sp. GXIMD14794]
MSKIAITFGAALLMTVPVGAFAQDAAVEIGRQEYVAACASCHGMDGTGTGPLAEVLEIETPDLTMLSQRMGSDTFPMWNTVVLIDGRSGVRAHGGEMPVWGDRFSVEARRPDNPSAAMEGAVPRAEELLTLGRIMAISYYLESIQQ